MRWAGLVIIMMTAGVILLLTLAAGPARWSSWSVSWWFRGWGGLLMVANAGAVVVSLLRRSLPALICHLGVVLMSAAIVRDIGAVEVLVELKPGERTAAANYSGSKIRPGFALELIDFAEERHTSQIRLDDQKLREVRPSHPARHKGWLILQDSYETVMRAGSFRLVTAQSETLNVATGERFAVPGRGFELEFATDIVMSKDTMFGFRVFEHDRPKVTGFISRQEVVPPSLKPDMRLIDYSLTAEYVSRFRLVNRPGSLLAFIAFGVMFIGVLLTGLRRTANAMNRGVAWKSS